MKLKIKIALSLAAVIAVAAMIFFFSAQNADDSSKLSGAVSEFVLSILVPEYRDMTPAQRQPYLERWGLVVRKAAHFTEFALLAVTLVCFLHYVWRNRAFWLLLLGAWVIASLYACTDEVHQMFVEGRGPGVLDVCIDSMGAMTGALASTLWLRARQKNRTTEAAG